jgi:hypothetical protein
MIKTQLTKWLPEEDMYWLETEKKRFAGDGIKTIIKDKKNAVLKNNIKKTGFALFRLTKLNGNTV